MTPRLTLDIFHPSTCTLHIGLSILSVELAPDFKEIYHFHKTERDCVGTTFCISNREMPASNQVGSPAVMTQIFRVFPLFFQVNDGIAPWSDHNQSLPSHNAEFLRHAWRNFIRVRVQIASKFRRNSLSCPSKIRSLSLPKLLLITELLFLTYVIYEYIV
jgi:hypothetical protein